MIKLRLQYYSTFLIVLFFSMHLIKAQDEKFKAVFVYNFTKYIDWPPKQGNFIITVLGTDPIAGELKGIASKKKVGQTIIQVNNIKTTSNIGNCHILFISDSKFDALAKVLAKAKENNILVITENKDACKKGSGINFVNKSGKILYEISKANIENNGLKVSGDLMQLGIVVN